MKKLLTVLFLIAAVTSFGQPGAYQSMPQNGYGPVKRFLMDRNGVLSIPLGISSLRNIPGGRDTGQIRYNPADSGVYVYSGNRWIRLATYVVTPVPQGTTTGIDSITFTAPRTLCYWKHDTSTCYTLANSIDSAKVVGGTQLCFYTAGVATCYTITGDIVSTAIDSITISGTNYCWWNNNSAKCVNIDNTTPFDTTYIYDSIAKVKVGVFSGDGSVLLIDSPGRRIDIRVANNLLSKDNEILSTGGAAISGDTVIIYAPIIYRLAGIQDTFTTDIRIVIPPATADYWRTDAIVIPSLGIIDTLMGIEDTIKSYPRSLDSGMLLMAYVDVHDDTVLSVKLIAKLQSYGLTFPDANGVLTNDSVAFRINPATKELFSSGGLILALNKRLSWGDPNTGIYYNGSNFLNFDSYSGNFRLNKTYGGTAPVMELRYDNLGTSSTGYINVNNFGIGTASPNASAALDISSTIKGFLPPRMTGVQMNAIASPAAGLIIYNTDSTALCFYNGSAWIKMGGASGGTASWGLTGTAGTDSSVNYFGTTDNQPVILKVNDNPIGKLGTNTNVSFGDNNNANGQSSFAVGISNNANGGASAAIGSYNTTNGYGSIAMGNQATASGYASIAIGESTIASGNLSTAIGQTTEASGVLSTAIGHNFNNTVDSSFEVGFGEPALHIGSNNLVGIGTTTPTARLHVVAPDTNVAKLVGLGNTVLLTDSALVIGVDGNIKKAVKSSGGGSLPTSVTLSTQDTTVITVAKNSGLSLSVGANKKYKIEFTLFTSCDTTTGIRLGLSGPSGSALASGTLIGSNASNGAPQIVRVAGLGSLSAGGAVALNRATGLQGAVQGTVFITTSSTPGTLTLIFAAAALTAAKPVYIQVGSTMELTENQ